MIKILGWVMLGVIVVVAGFLYRYESLDPCEWLTQDLTAHAGLQPVTGLGEAAGLVMENVSSGGPIRVLKTRKKIKSACLLIHGYTEAIELIVLSLSLSFDTLPR